MDDAKRRQRAEELSGPSKKLLARRRRVLPMHLPEGDQDDLRDVTLAVDAILRAAARRMAVRQGRQPHEVSGADVVALQVAMRSGGLLAQEMLAADHQEVARSRRQDDTPTYAELRERDKRR